MTHKPTLIHTYRGTLTIPAYAATPYYAHVTHIHTTITNHMRHVEWSGILHYMPQPIPNDHMERTQHIQLTIHWIPTLHAYRLTFHTPTGLHQYERDFTNPQEAILMTLTAIMDQNTLA